MSRDSCAGQNNRSTIFNLSLNVTDTWKRLQIAVAMIMEINEFLCINLIQELKSMMIINPRNFNADGNSHRL